MHMQEQDYALQEREEEFSRAVESIMRCEDFKSNFARKLSNRYISRSPGSSSRQDSSLKLKPKETRNAKMIPDKVPESIEPSSHLSIKMEQNREITTPPGKSMVSTTCPAEVAALQMEVNTLAWQLSQTEASRQMHIALLNQIVNFLQKVKGHIECQKPSEEGAVKDISKEREMQRSFSRVDLPRSRSVVHVNKHPEYSLGSKKIGTRKISKSISNVNGFKASSGTWNQSKLSLTSETDTYKMSEEISRLISLAKTVMSIKLPDLTSGSNDLQHSSASKISSNNGKKLFQSQSTLTEYEESTSELACDLVNELVEIKLNDEKQQIPICEIKSNSKTSKPLLSHRRLDYNHTTNTFIEDESGFSSMSSFQEIGIPIINIIPPSPNKDVGYHDDDIPELLEETGNWNNEIVLNKQNVKVFWV